MSEYQYYRFECVDGFLDSKQRQALREISSRAEISSNSFRVYYHYSGLKADTDQVMLDNFDIGFFYADWGVIEAYIKLPIGTLPEALLQHDGYTFCVFESEQWQLLAFTVEEFDDYFDDEQADEFFLHLLVLRNELIRGDWRLLYLVWLQQLEDSQEVSPVPMINFDFNSLSEAQLAFAHLFNIPLGLVKALALSLEAHPSHRPEYKRFNPDDWIAQLSECEKDKLLITLFEQGQLTAGQALALTRTEQSNNQQTYQHWLSAETLEPYIEIAHKLLEQEQAAELARKLAAEKAEKEARLSSIYEQREHVWHRAQEQANRKCASGYDQASRDLHHLAEAYHFSGESSAFELRFKAYLSHNNNRTALLRRIKGLLPHS